ncbi:hypothetical protein Ae168Ps1_5380 [Pseudonocardia sp. Ae168_Ps1]|nr:hypothetical protein Ae168Ps1_5380 [Pseudonocardia sp. Ae168_Ps1]OLL77569.1 hypothetical protein Ae150APs1_5947c [Pseudonocardia sp. Ae150A_Ps1]OLL88317.1 hypothetical protein Ae263Ps1_5372 [Pseudonocardia sp. Ae263_Ps1]OLL91659.1 hypothetical protein Ae356Ps1_1556c [Pseudonocardia sp. Ae356_Ps1]
MHRRDQQDPPAERVGAGGHHVPPAAPRRRTGHPDLLRDTGR